MVLSSLTHWIDLIKEWAVSWILDDEMMKLILLKESGVASWLRGFAGEGKTNGRYVSCSQPSLHRTKHLWETVLYIWSKRP